MPHKKGHSWGQLGKDINKTLRTTKHLKNTKLQSSLIKGKDKKDDKAFVKKTKAEIKNKKSRGGDGTGAGLSAEDRLKARQRTRTSQRKKDQMKELKKTNPERYKKLKKIQLKKERLKAFTASSSTWD